MNLLYFDENSKHLIKNSVSPDAVLEYYDILSRANQGYNPFRNDHKAGSFRKLRNGEWKDWAENKTYDIFTMISIMEDIPLNNFTSILRKACEIGGIEELFTNTTNYQKKERICEPSSDVKRFLGFSTSDNPAYFVESLGTDAINGYRCYPSKPNGNVMVREKPYYENYWRTLEQDNQGLIKEMIRRKAKVKITKLEALIEAISHPDSDNELSVRAWSIINTKKIKPTELISLIKTQIIESKSILIDFDGKGV